MSTVNSLFTDVVVQEFASISSDFGFREVQRNDREVRFESGVIYIIFFHTRYDEVEIAFGRLADEATGQMGFGVCDLLYSVDTESAKRSRARVASTLEQITMAVREIVSILRAYGKHALSGDWDTYRLFAERGTEMNQLYQDEIVASHVRPEADAAFRSGDYKMAARLYQSIAHMLSDVEQRKLEFAEKKTSQPAE